MNGSTRFIINHLETICYIVYLIILIIQNKRYYSKHEYFNLEATEETVKCGWKIFSGSLNDLLELFNI